MAWLGTGFHPSYSWAQPKYCSLFCQWLPWNHSRFLLLWLRSVSQPFPVELSSTLLLWLFIDHSFSSLKNRPTFSYSLRLLGEGGEWGGGEQIFNCVLVYQAGIRVDLMTIQRMKWTHCLEHWLSYRRSGPVGIWPKSPVPEDVFFQLNLVVISNFHKAMGEEALGSCPLALCSQQCWGSTYSILKGMSLGRD